EQRVAPGQRVGLFEGGGGLGELAVFIVDAAALERLARLGLAVGGGGCGLGGNGCADEGWGQNQNGHQQHERTSSHPQRPNASYAVCESTIRRAPTFLSKGRRRLANSRPRPPTAWPVVGSMKTDDSNLGV